MNNISYSTDEDDTYLQYNKDVKKKELDAAIEHYQKRTRRFGSLKSSNHVVKKYVK